MKETKEWLQRERSRIKKGELLRQANRNSRGISTTTHHGQQCMCYSFRYQVSALYNG